ncbi:MAG: hypothetical protein WD066_17430 [Planctomycetaceae bacterium]
MTYHGRVENGIVVLDDPAGLPEGTEVQVTPLASGEKSEPARSLAERFVDVIGIATDLPEDFARNHDHYVHGAPKR